MRDMPDRPAFVLLLVGALIVALIGGLVGFVKRLPAETSHITDINQVMLDGYSKELRKDPAPTILSETEQRGAWVRGERVAPTSGTKLMSLPRMISCAGVSQMTLAQIWSTCAQGIGQY